MYSNLGFRRQERRQKKRRKRRGNKEPMSLIHEKRKGKINGYSQKINQMAMMIMMIMMNKRHVIQLVTFFPCILRHNRQHSSSKGLTPKTHTGNHLEQAKNPYCTNDLAMLAHTNIVVHIIVQLMSKHNQEVH